MSKSSEAQIQCPACKKESSFTIWDSVNVDLDPQLKKAVMNGSLFQFQCPFCSAKTTVYYDLLYHDMSKHYMIQLTPGEEEPPEPPEIMMMMGFGEMMKNYRHEQVKTPQQLVEKIRIFDQSLDDRAS